MNTYEDWRLGSLEIASKIWGRPFHVNCSDFQWDCFHLSQKIKVHEIFLAKDTRETFMCPIAELTWVFNSRVILGWLFLALKLQTSELSKNLRLNCHQSTCLAWKQEKVKNYPWVETQVNSALGHINVTLHKTLLPSLCRKIFSFDARALEHLAHIKCSGCHVRPKSWIQSCIYKHRVINVKDNENGRRGAFNLNH